MVQGLGGVWEDPTLWDLRPRGLLHGLSMIWGGRGLAFCGPLDWKPAQGQIKPLFLSQVPGWQGTRGCQFLGTLATLSSTGALSHCKGYFCLFVFVSRLGEIEGTLPSVLMSLVRASCPVRHTWA